ncbi:MAG: triose-phosphate isomerase [Saprospiraceae bacterium]|nr:triose-phosphate isomerase [Saprospiraceae bacterium]
MRPKIAAGNWKMYKTFDEACELAEAIAITQFPDNVQVVLGVPSLYLAEVQEISHKNNRIDVAAQNCYFEKSGAFTGEISASMIRSVGVMHVILGHSERRQYFGETEDLILKKIKAVLGEGMTPIYCCGEPIEVRKVGNHNSFVEAQLEGSVFQLSAEEVLKLVIAYEPIWAIGTGETASPEQAQEMHQAIRRAIAIKFGDDTAAKIPILYGGSVKATNARELFSQSDVDGGLVGGASLSAEEFIQIIHSF